MKCYKCCAPVTLLNAVLVKSSDYDDDTKRLCVSCATNFIERLSHWKDFNPFEELVFWKQKG